MRPCYKCGEPRNEKTGECRNGCDTVTARPTGEVFDAPVTSKSTPTSSRVIQVGAGVRKIPTTKEER